MKNDASLDVAALQAAWASAFAARDFAAIVDLYDEDALFFGSAPGLSIGKSGVKTYFDNLPLGIALIDFPPLESRVPRPDVVIASGFWTFELDGETLEYRLAWTLVRRGAVWRIAQHHAGRKPARAI